MKTLTKSALKSAIRKIVDDATSKVVKLARKNGYEIASRCWDIYNKSDFEAYASGAQLIAKEADNLFRQENLDDFSSIIDGLVYGDLTFASKAEIEKFMRQFDTARKNYLAAEAAAKAAKKNDRTAKIARLRKQLAKLEAEEAKEVA